MTRTSAVPVATMAYTAPVASLSLAVFTIVMDSPGFRGLPVDVVTAGFVTPMYTTLSLVLSMWINARCARVRATQSRVAAVVTVTDDPGVEGIIRRGVGW